MNVLPATPVAQLTAPSVAVGACVFPGTSVREQLTIEVPLVPPRAAASASTRIEPYTLTCAREPVTLSARARSD